VLVNEVASLDVDSQLLAAQQSNAAAGIKAAQLAGGCACCTVAGSLQEALMELAGSADYAHLDYLVSSICGPYVCYMSTLQLVAEPCECAG
jgi:G3E family GTPase